jgi:hypothetical protein
MTAAGSAARCGALEREGHNCKIIGKSFIGKPSTKLVISARTPILTVQTASVSGIDKSLP